MRIMLPYLLLLSSLLFGCTEEVKTQTKIVVHVPPANLMQTPIEPIRFTGTTLKELLINLNDNHFLWAVQREQLRALIKFNEEVNRQSEN